MARRKTTQENGQLETADYRYDDEKRSNIPPAKIAAEGRVPSLPKARYYYSPHLNPALRFDADSKADRIEELLGEAVRRPLTPKEVELLAEATIHHAPWVEWASKREQVDKGHFEVDPVALHIHERVSAQAIVRTAMREDVERTLFADPEQPYHEAIQFYQHDIDWTNRLILGDSLQVMSSLARRENLAGKAQMIYIDPPYGIRYGSNFQPEVGRRDVGEKDVDLSREAETIRAYRDTWTLGKHSYLTYLYNRFIVAKELLSDSGSLFVQIGQQNVHLVRAILDEVFGSTNFVSQIMYRRGGFQTSEVLPGTFDYILWFSKTFPPKFYPLFTEAKPDDWFQNQPRWIELRNGEPIPYAPGAIIPKDARLHSHRAAYSASGGDSSRFLVELNGGAYFPPTQRGWSTNLDGFKRLIATDRLMGIGKSLRFKPYREDFPFRILTNGWTDTVTSGFGEDKLYAVQTASTIIQRCMLMTTDPGDLVLDPTCGSGTTAYVAEQWGRRWITIDTSRVAVAICRQRILSAKFDQYRTKGTSSNPASGFKLQEVPHVTLRSIAKNVNLDPIISRCETILDSKLETCNTALQAVTANVRRTLETKLSLKQKSEGKKAVSEGERRKWTLPAQRFEHWTIPFDTDPDWPNPLQAAVIEYRKAWRAKMDEVAACIQANADTETVVDRPEVIKNILRVSGPFTVEGMRPAELSIDDEGSPISGDIAADGVDSTSTVTTQNTQAYLTRMVQCLRADGITFLNNQCRKFSRIESLFESGSGSLIHAEGAWEHATTNGAMTVAIGFGPQYGPVTALQVEELIRAAGRQYDELVIAGFSFDAEAPTVIQETKHPKLRAIHQAYIRPDLNPGMDGLLKDTPKSQLFTVFGQPELEVAPSAGGDYICTLHGVDIYDPLSNTVRSTGAEKVAAWFLDADYDGRCFCITQAFFPDQNAWEKIAKALGSSADPDAFAAFQGTRSLPFPVGKYRRVAVKVIDPRGNEVMAVRALPEGGGNRG